MQNLGTRAREFALARWRGTADALPMQDGALLLDGLQEVYRFEALFAGEERQVEGEYEKRVHTQIKVN